MLDDLLDELGRDFGDLLATRYPSGFIPVRHFDIFVRCVRARLARFASSDLSDGRTLEQIGRQVGRTMMARYAAEIDRRAGHG